MEPGVPARRRYAAGALGWAATSLWPATANAALDPARLDRLDTLLRQATAPGSYLGAVALVIHEGHEGRTVRTLVQGHRDLARTVPMTADTIFRIYSMSKPIATVAVLMLMEEGRVTLDEPVSKRLPAFAAQRVGRGSEARAPRRPLTVQHLLTHTSGFALDTEVDSARSLQDYSERVARAPLATDPGERFAYDGLNTEVACHLVEVISGHSFDRYVQQHILDPLRLSDTGFSVPPAQRGRIAEMTTMGPQGRPVRAGGRSMAQPGIPLRPWPSGAGGLYSTAADYARFGQMLLGGGALDGVRLLGRKTVELMLMNHLTGLSPPTMPGSPGEGFGLGGSVLLDPARRGRLGSIGQYGWTGAGSTMFFIDPREQLLAVLMAQHLQGDVATDLPRLYAPFQNLVHQALH